MKNSLLGGLAIAATLLIQSAPASSQGFTAQAIHAWVMATLVTARRDLNISIAAMPGDEGRDMEWGPASQPWRRAP